jgi:DNA-binding IclR family transcriptional regulator
MQKTLPYRIESADKILSLIVLLRMQTLVRVTEAARELGVAPSTAHRLLAVLCDRGFAIHDGRRGYRPGAALGETQRQTLTEERLCHIVRPYLARLSERTAETVHLMVLEGSNVRFVDGFECAHTLRVGSRVGRVLPAHSTSGGKALLAEMPPDDVTALYPEGLPEWPNSSIADLAALRDRLATVRRKGFATNYGESEPGITAVGVCVRDSGGIPVAAITVAAPDVRWRRSAIPRLASALHLTADDITAVL